MRKLKQLITLMFTVFFLHSTVLAQAFVWAPDFPEGSKIPMLDAKDQNGVTQTLASLSGKNGLVLFFNRSFDWCSYCKAQLKGMVTHTTDFTKHGFNVAAMTYDSIEKLKLVTEDEGVQFKLLHDEAASHVLAFGILNKDYKPGQGAYGIPQPGIMILSPNGVILKKFAEENYRNRPDFDVVLEALDKL